MRARREWLLLAVMAWSGGCSQRDPWDEVVAVPTATKFAAWRTHVASRPAEAQRLLVEVALQEIRQWHAGERELKRRAGETVSAGSEIIDESVRQQVDGRRLGEVVRHGYGLRLKRLTEELAGLEAAIAQNAQLATKPGDTESQRHLDGLRARQLARVEQYRADLAATRRELDAMPAPAEE